VATLLLVRRRETHRGSGCGFELAAGHVHGSCEIATVTIEALD
jgi:hypothetical protein